MKDKYIMMRSIPFSHLLNLPDLGGYPMKDGNVTADFVFLRGDAPAWLEENEIQHLLNHDIPRHLENIGIILNQIEQIQKKFIIPAAIL